MLVTGAGKYFPEIRTAPVRSRWCHLRPMTPDGLPIIGQVPGTENAWIATGHGMLGITQGPATGRLLAEWIVHGTPSIDLTPTSAERFRRHRVVRAKRVSRFVEKRRCAKCYRNCGATGRPDSVPRSGLRWLGTASSTSANWTSRSVPSHRIPRRAGRRSGFHGACMSDNRMCARSCRRHRHPLRDRHRRQVRVGAIQPAKTPEFLTTLALLGTVVTPSQWQPDPSKRSTRRRSVQGPDTPRGWARTG